MLKLIFTLLFFALSFVGFSQNYTKIDTKVKNYPNFENIKHLTIRIHNDFSSDTDRVRAAFIWLTENIDYSLTLDDLFATNPKLHYYSEFGKKYQIKKYRLKQIQKAFDTKKGVCIDYSFTLDNLFKSLGIKSKIVYGLSKTDIKNIEGKHLIKNHTWNAVFLDGNWKLMDPTWAAGYFDSNQKKYIKKFTEYYYFTKPIDFVKNHFPINKEWQLLKNPMDLGTFYKGPIFFPDYFQSHLKLAIESKGTLLLSDKNESFLEFKDLALNKNVFYRLQGGTKTHKMKFLKTDQTYISKLKFHKNLKNDQYVTIFVDDRAVLNFRVQIESK